MIQVSVFLLGFSSGGGDLGLHAAILVGVAPKLSEVLGIFYLRDLRLGRGRVKVTLFLGNFHVVLCGFCLCSWLFSDRLVRPSDLQETG